MKRMTYGFSLAAIIAVAGCSTMAPKYERPVAPTAAAWPAGEAYVKVSDTGVPVADIVWQDFFSDPNLRKLIGEALANNRDLRVAALNIERAQAQYQIQGAQLLPAVNGIGDGRLQRIDSAGRAVNSHQYSVNLGVASYELDFFGRIRSLKDRALEEYLGTEQARRSMQMSLVSEVAAAYVRTGADLERLKLAQETLKNNEASYELTKRRYESGVSSELDLRQSQTMVETARVDIARFTSQVAQDRNALELLVGSAVPPSLLPGAFGPVTAVTNVSPGLPSEVLQRRPDILQAENQLRGANANIGAARAAFFPRIALTTSLGLGSDQLTGLFTGATGLWAFAPQINVPIFDGGTNKANLKVAEVDRNIYIAKYEKAIQVAFREVADALAQRGTLGAQLSAQQALVDATTAAYRLSQARYEKGVASYLAVLDSQRALYAAQQNLISLRVSDYTNLVTLYKVLGGGA